MKNLAHSRCPINTHTRVSGQHTHVHSSVRSVHTEYEVLTPAGWGRGHRHLHPSIQQHPQASARPAPYLL